MSTYINLNGVVHCIFYNTVADLRNKITALFTEARMVENN